MSFTLFSLGAGGTTNALGLGPKLLPAGSGDINIRDNFPWTLTPKSPLQETPYIRLQEYYVEQDQWTAMWETYNQLTPSFLGGGGQAGTAAGGGFSKNPYAGLYDNLKETNFTYTFPFFSDAGFTNANNWIEVSEINANEVLGAAGGVAGGLFNIFKGIREIKGKDTSKAVAGFGVASAIGGLLSTGIGAYGLYKAQSTNKRVKIVDRPKIWDNGQTKSVTIEFPLYNTVSEDMTRKNWEFCYLFTYQNLYNKRTYFTADPPVIYKYEIPGYHYSYASYVSNLVITNKGNMRAFNIDGVQGDVIIPDAYWVSITLTDLVVNSKNTFKLVATGEGLNY